jgi:CRP/FNR family cyclic AMP-dependent transcriptional regulator
MQKSPGGMYFAGRSQIQFQRMKKILLIEEQQETADNLRELLGLSNYAVIRAVNGGQGVRMAVAERPDLIISDVDLPVLDGYGVIHALQQYPETRSIPVIILTTLTGKDDFRRAMMAGADDYLCKPYDGVELLRSIDACLGKHGRRVLESHPGENALFGGSSGEEEGRSWHPGDREARYFGKKAVLYQEGQRASQVWYIVNGKVKTFLINNDGKELITHIYGPGDCVGYIAAVRGGSYTDNAKVVEDANLIIISRPEFLDILASDSVLARQLIRWLARNATEKEAGLLNLAYSSLRKKVANGILSLYDHFRGLEANKSFIMVSRDNLAAIVGAAPESLTRTLSDFKKEKLIDMSDGRIYLLDETGLRNMIN